MERKFDYIKVTRQVDMLSLANLVMLCFKMKVDHNYFNWKYFENPAGDVVAYIAISDNKIVAFYGVIPEWYWVDGQKVKVYQSMDTMTHPEYRRLGLFTILAKMCFEEVRKNDPDYLILGFPAPASHAGFIGKLGWQTLFLNKFWFNYNFLFKSLNRIANFNKGFSFKPVDTDSVELIEYFKTKRPLAKIEKYVDAEIFNWKIGRNQHKKYEPFAIYKEGQWIGLAVYYIDTPQSCQLVWVDFSDPDHFEFNAIGALVEHLFYSSKKKCIYIWGPLTGIQKRAFRRAGFLVNPFTKGPFMEKYPFILLTESANNKNWLHKENYNFQGLMLD